MAQALTMNGDDPTPYPAQLGSNQSGMRAYNERLALTMIRQAGALTKAEVTRMTGLSAQTVSVIMRALEADGLLVRGDPVRGKVGQPSTPMRLAPEGAFFFGLKVGRRSLDVVLTDFLGVVQNRIRLNHKAPTPDATVRFALEVMSELSSQLPAELRDRVAGLGIALPFQLWGWADMLDMDPAQMQGWKNRDIASEIQAQSGIPVFVCNDASAACGAELVFGDPGKPRDFLHFFVGFFIGGGLVLDNTLFTGPTGNAAALGSLMVPTPDGQMRQLVDVASLAALETEFAASSAANTMDWDKPDTWDVPDDVLDRWMTQAAQGIAHAVLSSSCLIDFSHVLIDGWMSDAMRAELVRRIQDNLTKTPLDGVDTPIVTEGSIGHDGRALGAASLPLSERFMVDRNSFLKGPTK